MGEYGLENINFKNSPEYNIIYSLSGHENADGFIPRKYYEDRNRLEPYFAPIGWRRLAINIELSPEKFWDLYSIVFIIICSNHTSDCSDWLVSYSINFFLII